MAVTVAGGIIIHKARFVARTQKFADCFDHVRRTLASLSASATALSLQSGDLLVFFLVSLIQRPMSSTLNLNCMANGTRYGSSFTEKSTQNIQVFINGEEAADLKGVVSSYKGVIIQGSGEVRTIKREQVAPY